MYLSTLSNEQKRVFYNLELHVSKIDGNFDEAEKQIMETHCMEMQIDTNNFECEIPLDTVISKLREEFGEREKRIVFLELSAMILADNVFHEEEERLTRRLAEILDISDADVDTVFSLIKQMKEAYEGCANFVGGC